MFEVLYGAVLIGIVIYLFVDKSGERDVENFRCAVDLDERVKKLEAQTRYVADQPPNTFTTSYDDQMYQTYQRLYGTKWEEELHKNDVPLTDVVKAIVKHLDMEIEKVSEKTVKTPQEIKVVEKPKVVMSSTGVVVMSDGSGISMPKPKRKYTKRKTK